jgi:hypothetical protein
MSNPNMEDYKGQTGLSPPAAYPSTMGNEENEVTSSLDTTSMLLVTTLTLARNLRLYQKSSTRASTIGTDDEPASL